MGIEITWLSGAGFRLTDSQGNIVFIDPWLDAPPGNPGHPFAVKDVTKADLVLVTHGDPGHYGRGDGVKIALQNHCSFASSKELCGYVLNKKLLAAAQVRSLEFKTPTQVGVARVVMFPIIHPPWTPPVGYEIPREPNTGFVVTLDGTTVLFAGDTVPGDMVYESVGEATKPLVGLLPIGSPSGSHGSLESTAQTVAKIAQMANMAYVIPHYNYVADNPAIEILRESLEQVGAKLVDLQPGETARFDLTSSPTVVARFLGKGARSL